MAAMRALVGIVVAAALLLTPGLALAQNTASITGTVTYLQRESLPANAVVTVQLADASRVGVPAELIAEQTFTSNGAQVPLRFELRYDPARIRANGVYSVQGNISVGGQLRYTTTTRYLVITGSRPTTNIQIVMQAAGSTSLPVTSGGNTALWIALVLLAVILALRLVGTRKESK